MHAIRTLPWAVALMIILAPAATAVVAQDAGGTVEIKYEKNTKITDVLDSMGVATGKTIVYDPSNTRVGRAVLGSAFSKTVPKDRVLDTYRALLSFYELTLVAVGPKGYEIYLVMDSRSTNNLIRNRAKFVDVADLERYKDRDGVYIVTTIQLRYIDNLVNLRQSLGGVMSPAAIGRVHEIPGSNSVILMDYAPTVYAAAQLIRKMDVQPKQDERLMTTIELKYAPAEELAVAITLLVKPDPPAQPRRPTGYITPKPGARIVAYGPRNALLIYATKSQLQLIEGLVADLDRPPKTQASVEPDAARR